MLKRSQSVRLLTLLMILGLATLTCFAYVNGVETAVASSNVTQDWAQAIPITTAANSPSGANFPVVKGSPDGKTVMVVFNRKRTATIGDNDPYYSRSLNNGETWSAPAAIRTSTANSLQVNLDYAANGVAHVAWVEDTGLAYANEGSKNAGSWAGSYTVLVPPISSPNPGTSSPYIVASGSSRIDIVWSEGNSSLPDPRIYHIRSKDNGSTFSVAKKIVFDTGWTQQFPAMAVENQSGIIHLVWQEPYDFFNPSKGKIVYSRGTESGGSMTWTTPVPISTVDDAREPEITLNDGTLQVVYTDYHSENEQYVYHTQCSANCTNVNNWSPTLNAISGQLVGANGADPLNVATALDQRGKCAIVYFHGTDINLADNEIIWGVNSCSGWSQSPRDQVTSDSVRSINPRIDVQNEWWLYLVYEQGSTIHQIFLHRGKPNINLPAVFK